MISDLTFSPELPAELVDHCAPAGQSRLVRYVELLLRTNAEFNLTAIRDPQEAWTRHVVESLRVVPLLAGASKLVDVGSGGGIPGMVLAIAMPEVHFTLLEASSKKARFLENAVQALALENVDVLCDRAETAAAVGSPLREAFDGATARAVAPLRVLLELTVPFVRLGGGILAIKGERAAEEVDEASAAMRGLHVTLKATHRHPTATVLIFQKQQSTSKRYPRKPGEPKRRPL